MTNFTFNLAQRVRYILYFFLVTLLMSCDSTTSIENPQQYTSEQITEGVDAKTNPVTTEQVAEAFALGSDSTDLQRDILTKKLVGSIVEWDIQVYEIDYSEGIYKITSQPFSVKSKDTINMMRASITLTSSGDWDDELLRKTKTNDTIRIRGKIQAVMLRTVVTIDPAILVLSSK